ncbi:MAG: SET domain-containing protein [Saprospiraceae bacterium]
MQQIPGLYISMGIHGRGVFCGQPIPKGSLIELSPVLVIPKNEVDIIHHTELHDYYFVWGEQDEEAALALGYGSLYNHSYAPNANFEMDLGNLQIRFFAIKNIAAGEEITINYHGEPESKDELWFDKSGKRVKRIKHDSK